MITRILAGAALISLTAAQPAAADGPRVKLKAEPAYGVMQQGAGGKAYVRISLEGLPIQGEAPRAPVNVALVIDRSGSMQGPKMQQAKQAAIAAIARLAAQDVISVIAFNHGVYSVVPAGPYENAAEIERRIGALVAEGQTAIFAAVKQAGDELAAFRAPGRFTRVILLSDGQANVGPSSPLDLERLGRDLGGAGVSVTTLGLGLGYNEDLMTRLALASDGNHAFIENPEQLADVFNREFGDILSVVGQDIDIVIDCPEGVTPLRVLGREAKVEGRRVTLKLSQLYAAQERYLIVEMDVAKGKAQGSGELAAVQAAYTDARTQQRVVLTGAAEIRFSASPQDVENSINAAVLSAVTTQIATERSERAVRLRDEGKVAEARQELQGNAAYLRDQAGKVAAAPAAPPGAAASLNDLSAKNEEDAKSLEGGDWERKRKDLRYRQHKDKTQQKY